MDLHADMPRSKYRIKIRENLSPAMLEWFGEMSVTLDEEVGSVLVVEIPDQAALRGILTQLWNFNITVLSVDRIEDGYDE